MRYHKLEREYDQSGLAAVPVARCRECSYVKMLELAPNGLGGSERLERLELRHNLYVVTSVLTAIEGKLSLQGLGVT